MSETAKYLHLTRPFCGGIGVDIGSQGNPVVPWAMQVDLPRDEFRKYCGSDIPDTIQLPIGCEHLPFKDRTLDFVYSSHLLEDFMDWKPLLVEWSRVLKPHGHLVILIPDRDRWAEAVRRGQPPNCAHKHEGYPGELSEYASELNLLVIRDSLTDLSPNDYSILFIGRKL
jgi:SAM-dependent methyltransferase